MWRAAAYATSQSEHVICSMTPAVQGPGPRRGGEGRMVLTGKRRKPVVIIKGKGDKVSVLFCTALSAHAASKKN